MGPQGAFNPLKSRLSNFKWCPGFRCGSCGENPNMTRRTRKSEDSTKVFRGVWAKPTIISLNSDVQGFETEGWMKEKGFTAESLTLSSDAA